MIPGGMTKPVYADYLATHYADAAHQAQASERDEVEAA